MKKSCFVFLVLALALCGCSTFNYEWRQAMKAPAPESDITGPWEGRWFSEPTAHADTLRCLITKVDEQNYDAKFHAAYKRWVTVRFGYTVRLHTEPGTNGVRFRGREDLGRIAGGVYEYEGHADATNFFSRYRAKYDHGTFQMGRPQRQPGGRPR